MNGLLPKLRKMGELLLSVWCAVFTIWGLGYFLVLIRASEEPAPGFPYVMATRDGHLLYVQSTVGYVLDATADALRWSALVFLALGVVIWFVGRIKPARLRSSS
jgi:hypothetical protein